MLGRQRTQEILLLKVRGGILRNSHPSERPIYEPSKRRLTWPNGSWATVYSSEEPDQLRGFSGDTAWFDELAKFSNPQECWDNLAFGMREASSDRPRILVTTTPRPIAILTSIEKSETTVVVTGTSYENRSNLDRLGRQEIHAEYLDDVVGALWTRSMLEAARFNCGPITEIRKGHAPVSTERSASVVGVWAG